jgi:hypothetical protein
MVVSSLSVDVVEVDGVWWASAPWLSEPLSGGSYTEAFTKAMMAPKR